MASCDTENLLGRVKWFNNKTGYGFVTITDGPRSGTDIFVHHSAISSNADIYRYLVHGEYVSFNMVRMPEGSKHEWQAVGVQGVRGGKLMCETRQENRLARTQRRARRGGVTEGGREGDEARATAEEMEPLLPTQRVPETTNEAEWVQPKRGRGRPKKNT